MTAFDWRAEIHRLKSNAVREEQARVRADERRHIAEDALYQQTEARMRAEAELEKLRGSMPVHGYGGTYLFQYDWHERGHELIEGVRYEGALCQWLIIWSDRAREAGLTPQNCTVIDRRTIMIMPQAVAAESWWHVCAQVGIVEAVARVLYRHPEEGQPSAVAMLTDGGRS